MQRELVRLALVDPLTGLSTRRAFFERAEQVCTRGRTLTAIMLDIDHFKRINDLYGHDVGDRAIAGVALLAGSLTHLSGRLGGEEFALLIEGCALAEGVSLAEKLRRDIAALRLETARGPLELTCSFGVSEYKTAERLDDLLKRADVALYAAKSGGRNRVVAAEASELEARASLVHAIAG
jgi:diguanylate cyclase (GGDEF)-like protein